METRIESDIACIKAAVSNYARHDARFASLDARIDRVQEELRGFRSKLYEVELFQSAVKGVLFGLGAMLVIALIVAILKAAAGSPTDAAPKEEASEHANVTHP